jgi:hypothetical protein
VSALVATRLVLRQTEYGAAAKSKRTFSNLKRSLTLQHKTLATCFQGAAALLLSATLATASVVPVDQFSDSFEGISIYSYWSKTQQSGTVSTSKDHAYSGSQSLKFASTPGNQVDLVAMHKFPKPTKGTVSVSFYDAAAGQQTLYQQLVLSDSRYAQNSSAVGTQDFDAQCYMAYAATGAQGPNATCGSYPQLETSAVKRTPGWHVFQIHYDVNTVTISIDGTVVFVGAGNFYFDTVQMVASGPGWRPAGLCYFDNYSFTPLPVYEN